MRSCRKNRQKLMYSTQVKSDPRYSTDENGEIIYDEVDGEYVPRMAGASDTMTYTKPVEFYGNIHNSGGQTQDMDYGKSVVSYDAVLYLPKNGITLDETCLIWFENGPVYKDDGQTSVDPSSADYQVIRVPPCLDERVYLLKRVDK